MAEINDLDLTATYARVHIPVYEVTLNCHHCHVMVQLEQILCLKLYG